MRLTRIGRSLLEKSDVLTTNLRETFLDENVTMSTVKTLATKHNPDAESYDQYMYLQQPWSERWSKDVDEGIIRLFDDHLILITESSLIAVDMDNGIFRKELLLDKRSNSACHASGSDYMYLLGQSDLDDGQTTITCIEIVSLTVNWSKNVSSRDPVSCAVTPDDQRLYIGGNFGLTQLDTSEGDEIWTTQTLSVSTIVSDNFGNAVVAVNDDETNAMKIYLIDKFTGSLHGIVSDFEIDNVFTFLWKQRLYMLSVILVVMVLSMLISILWVRQRSKGFVRKQSLHKKKKGTLRPRVFSTLEERDTSKRCKDMEPFLPLPCKKPIV